MHLNDCEQSCIQWFKSTGTVEIVKCASGKHRQHANACAEVHGSKAWKQVDNVNISIWMCLKCIIRMNAHVPCGILDRTLK